MKTALAVAAVVMLSAASVRAEQITMSLSDAKETLLALSALSSGKSVIIEDADKKREVKVQYKGWSLALILAITKNIDALKPSVTSYASAHDKKVQELTGEDGKMSIAAQKAFLAEDEKILANMLSFDLTKFKASELKPDTNEISPLILSGAHAVLNPE